MPLHISPSFCYPYLLLFILPIITPFSLGKNFLTLTHSLEGHQKPLVFPLPLAQVTLSLAYIYDSAIPNITSSLSGVDLPRTLHTKTAHGRLGGPCIVQFPCPSPRDLDRH